MEEEKKLMYELIIDCWSLIKTDGFSEMSDEQWEKLIDQAHEIEVKWKNRGINYYHLYRRMVNPLIDHIENLQRRYKRNGV